MKRKIFVLLMTAVMLCVSSCSGGKPEPKASPSEITGGVLEQITINSAFEKDVSDFPYFFNSIDISGIEEASYFMCASGAYPDEIAVMKFSSAKLAEDGLKAVKNRLESQRSTYETYTPAEMYKFDDAVAEARGKYVIYIITSDNAKALKIVDGY